MAIEDRDNPLLNYAGPPPRRAEPFIFFPPLGLVLVQIPVFVVAVPASLALCNIQSRILILSFYLFLCAPSVGAVVTAARFLLMDRFRSAGRSAVAITCMIIALAFLAYSIWDMSDNLRAGYFGCL